MIKYKLFSLITNIALTGIDDSIEEDQTVSDIKHKFSEIMQTNAKSHAWFWTIKRVNKPPYVVKNENGNV